MVPAATSLSARRRAAVWNAVRQVDEQNRCREPRPDPASGASHQSQAALLPKAEVLPGMVGAVTAAAGVNAVITLAGLSSLSRDTILDLRRLALDDLCRLRLQ